MMLATLPYLFNALLVMYIHIHIVKRMYARDSLASFPALQCNIEKLGIGPGGQGYTHPVYLITMTHKLLKNIKNFR